MLLLNPLDKCRFDAHRDTDSMAFVVAVAAVAAAAAVVVATRAEAGK